MGGDMGGAEPAAPVSQAHHFCCQGGGESFSNHKNWGGEGGGGSGIIKGGCVAAEFLRTPPLLRCST